MGTHCPRWRGDTCQLISVVGSMVIHYRKERKERKKDDSYVVTGMNYGISSFLSWSKSVCNLKIGMMRIKRARKTIASF